MSQFTAASTAEEKRRLIDLLSKHQDQQHKFLDSMEAIRWKFVTGFGVGAVLAIVYASNPGDPNGMKLQIGSVVVIVISLASLLAQIRIYGLVHCCWERIRLLQVHESAIAQDLYGISDIDTKAFVFPHVSFEKTRLSHLLTVHSACCLVFATFIGIGAELLKQSVNGGFCFPYCGIAVSIFVLTASWQVSAWYSRLLGRAS